MVSVVQSNPCARGVGAVCKREQERHAKSKRLTAKLRPVDLFESVLIGLDAIHQPVGVELVQ